MCQLRCASSGNENAQEIVDKGHDQQIGFEREK